MTLQYYHTRHSHSYHSSYITGKYYARTQVHWDNTKVTGRPRQQERNRITELEEALKTSESMLESDGMECEASEVGYRFLEKKSDNDTTMPPPVRAMLCEEAKNDCGSLQNIISFDSFRCPICTCLSVFDRITWNHSHEHHKYRYATLCHTRRCGVSSRELT